VSAPSKRDLYSSNYLLEESLLPISTVVIKIDCLGFFEEIVRRIYVTFGGRRHKSRWNAKVFKSSNLSYSTERKKAKKKREKRREKTYNRGYI
jgi:hypothetical protein